MQSPLRVGDVVDGFTLLKKVHEGSMAELYRVSKADADMPLVMKIPKLGFGSHPACYVGFEVEQMILEKLKGPHVPKFIAKGDMAAQPYLVMEYIEGPSLHDGLENGLADVEEIARRMTAVAGALHDVHRQNVVHLDLKPANILFRPDGTAVLIDFGLAHHAQLPDLVQEAFNKPVGTAAYIAPEQIYNRRCDPRSDIFALGAILYQLTTQTLPFGAPTTWCGMRRRMFLEPRPPRAIRPDTPPWLQEIILHCLEVSATNRYASAAQVALDLAHHEQITITSRGRRTRRSIRPRQILLRWYSSFHEKFAPCPAPIEQLGEAPHLLVALDVHNADEALLHAMLEALRAAAHAYDRNRISCITVLDPVMLSEANGQREMINSLYTRTLIALRHWAQPLGLSNEIMRFQVLEAGDAAQAVLDFARKHHVDHILVGARGSSVLRRILGGVSAKIAAEALCNVTVVRVPRAQVI